MEMEMEMEMAAAAAAEEASSSCSWSWEQDRAFENALAVHGEDCADRWGKIAADVPGKSAEQVREHYELLVEDVNGIESGRVPLPHYVGAWEGLGDDGGDGKKGKGSKGDQERRKGVAWTEDEHKLFLLGLERYGKGDWRSISRNFVVTRTPTQVASHAQKYFIRLNSMNKDRRRTSIHDITSVGNGDISAPPGPITGQTNGQTVAAVKSAKQSPLPPVGPPPVVDAYGTTIGQPVGGPMVSAVGTPVHLPIPPPPHMAYGVQAPVARAVVPGAPMNLSMMTYPMPPTSAH